jgi:lipopolysaccharide biosynthesis protein
VSVNKRARVIAFYLPQFHPIPENDEWWGSGFTEWRNVAKARPLFRGHYQPRIPGELGFYDLRVPETRWAQAELARAHGVEAFCYWHYWFAGRRILERPFTEVVRFKEPDFPFCLAWANQTWTGIWHGLRDKILIEQTYPGRRDYIAHFQAVLPAFEDPRYVTVDGKALFYVYMPREMPSALEFTDLWRELALKAGLKGLYLVGEGSVAANARKHGFDAGVETSHFPPLKGWRPWSTPLARLRWEWHKRSGKLGKPTIYRYADVWESFVRHAGPSPHVAQHACLLPGWDNTPRSGRGGLVLHDSTPELFRRQVRKVLTLGAQEPIEHRLVFLKSWNEWAEGNYMEPDLRFGRGYLEALRDEVFADRGLNRRDKVEGCGP